LIPARSLEIISSCGSLEGRKFGGLSENSVLAKIRSLIVGNDCDVYAPPDSWLCPNPPCQGHAEHDKKIGPEKVGGA